MQIPRQQIVQKLSKYSNGGNAFLILEYLLNFKQVEIVITQEQLAEAINKTRPAVQKSLELLRDEGFIEISYKKIKILKEIV